jgi:hypothetical protein
VGRPSSVQGKSRLARLSTAGRALRGQPVLLEKGGRAAPRLPVTSNLGKCVALLLLVLPPVLAGRSRGSARTGSSTVRDGEAKPEAERRERMRRALIH